MIDQFYIRAGANIFCSQIKSVRFCPLSNYFVFCCYVCQCKQSKKMGDTQPANSLRTLSARFADGPIMTRFLTLTTKLEKLDYSKLD